MILLLILRAFTAANIKCEGAVDEIYHFPRIFFSYWGSDDIPEDVEEILNVTKKNIANFTFSFATEKNISNKLDTDLFPSNFHKLCPACKSQYIEVCLLAKYGGFWVDSTIYVNSASSLEKIYSESLNRKCEVVGFGNEKFILSTFLGAPGNSKFMKKIKSEMERVIVKENISLAVMDVCKRMYSLEFAEKSRKCKNSYYWVDVMFTRVMKDYRKKTYKIFPLKGNTYELTKECKYAVGCIRYRLMHDTKTRKIPFIKVYRHVRTGKRLHFDDNKYVNNVTYEDWKSHASPESIKEFEHIDYAKVKILEKN